MENKSLFTIITDLPSNYIKNLKEKIKYEILNIAFCNNNKSIQKYNDYINIITNKKIMKIFINFKNKYIVKCFCKNIKNNNKFDIDCIDFQLYPDYKTFSWIKINNINKETTNDILYDYINNLKYINYCFFIKDLKYIFFSFKDDAENFMNEKHVLDNVVLEFDLIKLYDEISEDMDYEYECYKNKKLDDINEEKINIKDEVDYNLVDGNIPNLTITVNGEKIENISNIENIFDGDINKDEKVIEEENSFDESIRICNKNIEFFSEFWENHINTIKQNYNVLYEKTNNNDLKTYYIQSLLGLNTFISNIKLFEKNHNEIHSKLNNKTLINNAS